MPGLHRCHTGVFLILWDEAPEGAGCRSGNDHAMDDIRYFAATVASGWEFFARWVERKEMKNKRKTSLR